MERLKTILLCVLLACVSPAMAADWYEIPENGNYGVDTFTGYNYNPNPDQAALDAWAVDYTPDFTNFGTGAPYYEESGETAGPIINDPTAEVRFNMITADLELGANALTAGTMYMGDTYWPWNYTAFSGNYSAQTAKQEGGAVTLGTLNFGRPNDFAAVDMETNSLWFNRGGTLDIGTINVLSTNTTSTYQGRSFSLIGNSGSTNNAAVTTIGDINLNEQTLFLQANAGSWDLTGDVGLMDGADAGSMAFALFGYNTYDRATVEAYCATLDVKWTTLMNMIDNGWFYVVMGDNSSASSAAPPNQAYYATRFRPGYEFDLNDFLAGNITGCVQITRSNMYDFLDIIDNGNGTVNVANSIPVNVPEPATMILLGLGAVLSFRRKR